MQKPLNVVLIMTDQQRADLCARSLCNNRD